MGNTVNQTVEYGTKHTRHLLITTRQGKTEVFFTFAGVGFGFGFGFGLSISPLSILVIRYPKYYAVLYSGARYIGC